MRSIIIVSVAAMSAVAGLCVACSSDSGTPSNGVGGGDAAADSAPATDGSSIVANDGGSDAPAHPVSCDEMCRAAMQACSGANQAYASLDECLRECGDMAPGDYGDSTDSVGCRQAHANQAAQNPAKECAAASTFGGGVCGDRCDSYCLQIVSRCSGNDAVYLSKVQCDQYCGAAFSFDSNKPEFTDAGNTLNCRMYWTKQLLVPDGGDVTTDCPNAGPQSPACK